MILLCFIAGTIVGLLLSILVLVILIYYRVPIEKYTRPIERKITEAGPKSKGFIFEPLSDADASREEIIKKNQKEGKDTHISELI